MAKNEWAEENITITAPLEDFDDTSNLVRDFDAPTFQILEVAGRVSLYTTDDLDVCIQFSSAFMSSPILKLPTNWHFVV